MKTMILAAGRGERMRPLTDRCPKPLLEVGGKPLIVYHIENLAAAGFTELVINVAYRGSQIKQALGDGSQWGVRIEYSEEGKQALETGGGIVHALPLLGKGPFLVVNGDIWTDFDFGTFPKAPDALAHLVLVDNPEHNPEGDFALENERVSQTGSTMRTFSGIGIYRPELFDGQPDAAFPLGPLLRDTMDHQQVSGQYHSGQWTDVGTPDRLIKLDQLLSY